MRDRLYSIYQKLYASFGPQHWWPAKTEFEVIVGAILTQNTAWINVEKAIRNLKKNKLLSPTKLYRLPEKKLAVLIRATGYYNIKTQRLKEFMRFLFSAYQGRLKDMSRVGAVEMRQQLLSVKGIGPETADSILLYAFNKPAFVIDAYTKRIFTRHHLLEDNVSYATTQNLFMQNLKHEVKLFNEYHALLVKLGKDFCLKSKPRCKACPLGNFKIPKLKI